MSHLAMASFGKSGKTVASNVREGLPGEQHIFFPKLL